jgi:hypothetical protein
LGNNSKALVRNGELAQLVEQRTFNPFVTRSIRVLPTKNSVLD